MQSAIENEENVKSVVLIAHSMGGLVASSFLAKSQENIDKVELLITFGTPFMGAADAMEAFETGGHMGILLTIAIGRYLREISPNITSVYELLQTSRYGPYITLLDLTDPEPYVTILSHLESRSFLGSREWALRDDGYTKSMMEYSEDFHDGLMRGDEHIANIVNSYYFYMAARRTRSMAVYLICDIFGHNELAYFLMADGDDTVTARSATNGRNSNVFRVTQGDHVKMLNDEEALEHMRYLITQRAKEGQSLNETLEQSRSSSHTDISNYISIVTQGIESIYIYDSDGNRIIQRGRWLYRQTYSEKYSRVGEKIVLNADIFRFQFVLDPEEYIFDNIFSEYDTIEIMVMNFEGWLQTSKTIYSELASAVSMLLQVSPMDSLLYEVETKATIDPSVVASQESLQRLNEVRISQDKYSD